MTLSPSHLLRDKSRVGITLLSLALVFAGIALLVLPAGKVGGAVNLTYEDVVASSFAGGVVDPTSPEETLKAVDCPATQECAAVGSFRDSSGHRHAFAQLMTAGTWATAVPVVLPAGSESVASPDSWFSSISCASAGNCTAAGVFTDVQGRNRGMVATMVAGVWATAIPFSSADESVLGPDSFVADVSCPAADGCVAVGQFNDTSGNTRPFAMDMTSGTWNAPEIITMASSAQAASYLGILSSVSCPSVGTCAAVGNYATTTSATNALNVTMVSGVWSEGTAASFPAGSTSTPANSYLYSVDCPSAGNCAASGFYQRSSPSGAMSPFTQNLVAGTWSETNPVVVAGGVEDLNSTDSLNSISCSSVGNCTAAGDFTKNMAPRGLTVTASAGTWAEGRPVDFSSWSPSVLYSEGYGASCAADGYCTAVGYATSSTGGNAYMTTMQGGDWGTPHAAPFASGMQGSYTNSVYNAVSCAAALDCVAVGSYLGADGFQHAFAGRMWGTLPPPTTSSTTSSTTSTTAPVTTTTSGGVTPITPSDGKLLELTPGKGAMINPDGTVSPLSVTQSGPSTIKAATSVIGMELSGSSATGAELTLQPGGPGSTSGFGFQAGTEVTIFAFSTPVVLGTATVADDGTFSSNFPVPSDLAPGNHTVQAQGTGEDGQPRALLAGVSVAGLAVTGAPLNLLGVLGGVLLAGGLVLLGGSVTALAGRSRRRSE